MTYAVGAFVARAMPRHSFDDMLGQKRGQSRLCRCVARRFQKSVGPSPTNLGQQAGEHNALLGQLDLSMPAIDLDNIRAAPTAPRRHVTPPAGAR
jgi:hypothetical protein